MGVVRLRAVASLVVLAGCCLNVTTGTNEHTGESGTGGETTGGESTSTSGSTSAGSSSGGSTTSPSIGTTGGISGGTTGSSTGGSVPNLEPTFLLDAGIGMIFGPVAIAAQAQGFGTGIAKLVYSAGVIGALDICLQALSDQGTATGQFLTVAATSPSLTSPPNVTVFDDGTNTGVCWEDVGPIVQCASVSDDVPTPESTYSQFGVAPQLVFNPLSIGLDGGGAALLFFVQYFDDGYGEEEDWAYQSAARAQTVDQFQPKGVCNADGGCQPLQVATARVPVAAGWDAITRATPYDGLQIVSSNFTAPGGFSASYPDPSFSPVGQLAATSEIDSQTVGALELDNHGLRAITWDLNGGLIGNTPIPATPTPTGPLGAGTCPNGFGYLTMTDGGLFVSETDFEGDLMANAGGLLVLDDFESAVTSMAVATNLQGDLLVAVSNQGQVAVYLVPCQ